LRALIVGPKYFGYNSSIARALQRHGFEVEVIRSPTHTPEGLVNRLRIDLLGAFGVTRYACRWRKAFNERILARAQAFQPDLLLLIKGDWVDPETFAAMPAKRRVIWFHDSLRRSGPDHVAHARVADAAFVFEGSDVATLREAGVASAFFLPMGYDGEIYSPRPVVEKDIDVAFVGRTYANRRAFFERLIADFPQCRFAIYGRYLRYREVATWKTWVRRQFVGVERRAYHNRDVMPQEVAAIYRRSRIVLNIHHAQSRQGCNPRSFEIPGAGAFQIVDANAFVQQCFGTSVAQFDGYDSLKAQLTRYLADEPERARLAMAANRIAERHTFDARISEMLAVIGMGGALAA
jgi:spore maturation protein CgeB